MIAFEVDAYDPATRTGWSVLAIGRSAIVDDPEERAALERRATSRRGPTVRATRIVRLHPEMLTGRRIVALTAGRAGSPSRSGPPTLPVVQA